MMIKINRSASWMKFIFGLSLLFNGCHGWLFHLWGPTCYEDPPIGCFPTRAPWTNSHGFSPQSPSTINTYFYHHLEDESPRGFRLDETVAVMEDFYNTSKKTVLIIHGYMEHTRRGWVHEMITELYAKNDANIITVDWGPGASSVYYQSVANTRVVGAVVALMLQTLESMGGDVSTFHLLGFSLGAHIAGYAGSRVPGLGRITGLDPAGPAFEGTPPEVRLDPTDAELVDVIHTDGAEIVGCGTLQAMGDIDFYPNSGRSQPGCPTSLFSRVSAFFTRSLDHAVACSHFFVLDIFMATINNTCSPTSLSSETLRLTFASGNSNSSEWHPCQSEASCPRMGYNLDTETVQLCRQQGSPDAKLLMAMQTEDSWPFC